MDLHNLPRGCLDGIPTNKKYLDKLQIPGSFWDFGEEDVRRERRKYGVPFFNHPARYRPIIVDACLKLWGESPVLDPMAGTHTTLFVAEHFGFEAWGNELESKFIGEVKKNLPIIRLDNIIIDFRSRLNCGDARNLPYQNEKFGFIMFSPPYFNAIDDPKVREGYGLTAAVRSQYSDSEDNIGNIRDYNNYLAEMSKIYSECYRILKPDKYMVVVVKDLMREGGRAPIGVDTVNLCRNAGFYTWSIIANKLRHFAVWVPARVKEHLEKNHPVTMIDYEWIIVMKKLAKI